MWCANCQADVAGEVSPDARSLLCTTCGCEVSSIRAPGNLSNARGARELLERWNTEEILDPYQPGRRTGSGSGAGEDAHRDLTLESGKPDTGRAHRTDALSATSTEAESSQAADEAPTAEAAVPLRESRIARRPSQRTFRLDAGHASAEGETPPAGAPHQPRDISAARGGRLDDSHDSAPSPHFNIASAFERRRSGRRESFWGQLLAYAGVGVLTAGTGLVVWGYFGGPASYTPTGWLLATAGQMLLFLGVVTLISGGMEQTTHEVTRRIERLGDQIIRIERHAAGQSLRGPHFSASESPNDHRASASREKSASET